MSDPDELTLAEIARMLGRPELWVDHVLKLGDLPSQRRLDVEAFVADQRSRDAAAAEIGDHTDEE